MVVTRGQFSHISMLPNDIALFGRFNSDIAALFQTITVPIKPYQYNKLYKTVNEDKELHRNTSDARFTTCLFVHLVCTCFFFSSPDGRNREGEEQQRDKVGEAKEKGRWAVSEGVGFVIVTGEW